MSKSLSDISAILHLLTQRGLILTHFQADDPALADTSMLIFRLGEEHYGIPAHTIRAIQPLGHYRPLPLTRSWIVGVTSVLGKLLTVIDIRPLVCHEAPDYHLETMLLIVGLDGLDVGLVIDGLVNVPGSVANLVQSSLPLSAISQRSR